MCISTSARPDPTVKLYEPVDSELFSNVSLCFIITKIFLFLFLFHFFCVSIIFFLFRFCIQVKRIPIFSSLPPFTLKATCSFSYINLIPFTTTTLLTPLLHGFFHFTQKMLHKASFF